MVNGAFSSKIDRFVKQAIVENEEVAKAAGITLVKSVIRDTPVDKGRLAGNWIASNDMPEFAIRDSEGRNASLAQAIPVISNFKIDDTFYLTNSLPYAYRIEFEGYSKIKAPQGMVRKNVQRISANLNR